MNYLANSGIKVNGEPLVREEFLNKGSKLDKQGAFRRAGEVFQNTLDIWKGVHPLAWNVEHLKDYFLFGEYPKGLGEKDPIMAEHDMTSFFSGEFGMGANKDFERTLFSIIHNTLNL